MKRFLWRTVSLRRFLHQASYFLASILLLWLFLLALLCTESLWYWFTGDSVSVEALALAALLSVSFFSPLLGRLQRHVDRHFFRRRLDMASAIQALGADDLAHLPVSDIEMALLQRIVAISGRPYAALCECHPSSPMRQQVFPSDAPMPPSQLETFTVSATWEFCLLLPLGDTKAYLLLAPHKEQAFADDEELKALQALARFVALSLAHAHVVADSRQQAKLDSMARVASQMHSHDLKNRLHDLAFLAHNLQDAELDRQDVQRLLASITKVVSRMETLMNRIEDPNLPLRPKFRRFHIQTWLQGLLNERLWPEQCSWTLHCTDEHIAIEADQALLRGVLDNLFDNAVQAMQGSGHIDVSITASEHDLLLTVRDQGCGMSQDFLQNQLFSLFATSKADGLGVGLYLSRRIVLAHQGEIWAESEGVGCGASFKLRLPLLQEESE